MDVGPPGPAALVALFLDRLNRLRGEATNQRVVQQARTMTHSPGQHRFGGEAVRTHAVKHLCLYQRSDVGIAEARDVDEFGHSDRRTVAALMGCTRLPHLGERHIPRASQVPLLVVSQPARVGPVIRHTGGGAQNGGRPEHGDRSLL